MEVGDPAHPGRRQMTSLPFEDLPEKPAQTASRFDEFWFYAVRKIAKGDARKAYRAAIKRESEDKIIRKWIEFNKRASGGCWLSEAQKKFIPYPATWLRADQWEDEYDTPSKPDPDLAWQHKAAMAKTSWGRHNVPRQDKEELHRMGLLTDDELAEALR